MSISPEQRKSKATTLATTKMISIISHSDVHDTIMSCGESAAMSDCSMPLPPVTSSSSSPASPEQDQQQPRRVSVESVEPKSIAAPGPFDVICARGKSAYNHEGNRRFRMIVASAAERYSKVESKLQRSMIVTDIVDTIRSMGNGFVRRSSETGEWVQCSDVMCREKVGQHFRNALGCQYKSSTRSKSERRAKEQIAAPKLMGSLRDIVFSSEAVTRITERLAFDVIFVEGCDSSSADEEFFEKALASNVDLLNALKEDQALVRQFQTQFSLGQSQRELQEQRDRRSSSSRINSMSAMAA